MHSSLYIILNLLKSNVFNQSGISTVAAAWDLLSLEDGVWDGDDVAGPAHIQVGGAQGHVVGVVKGPGVPLPLGGVKHLVQERAGEGSGGIQGHMNTRR